MPRRPHLLLRRQLRRRRALVRRNPEEDAPMWQNPLWQVWALTGLVSAPFAMAMSYKRNQSIGWALVHGIFVPRIYVIYRMIGG